MVFHFLKSAIKSIKIKKIENVEHIIVCSPSTDGTETYLNTLSNVKIIMDKDSTTRYGSINKGINIASGDIIGLLHADDIFYDELTLYKILQQFHDKNDVIYEIFFFVIKKIYQKLTESG